MEHVVLATLIASPAKDATAFNPRAKTLRRCISLYALCSQRVKLCIMALTDDGFLIFRYPGLASPFFELKVDGESRLVQSARNCFTDRLTVQIVTRRYFAHHCLAEL